MSSRLPKSPGPQPESETELRKCLVSRGLLKHADPIRPLSGGRTNRLWHVDTSAGSYVIKLFANPGQNPLFDNRPDDEARLLLHLSGTGLVTDLHDTFNSPLGPVLVYSFVSGRTWATNLDLAAHAFRKLHQQPVPDFLPTAPNGSEALASQTLQILAACPAQSARQLLSCRPDGHVPESSENCLLHGDPVPGNLIVSQQSLVFIDWQCPAQGDPVNDIAIFLSPAMQQIYRGDALSGKEVSAFLSALENDALAERYRALAPWYHWRMAAYCLWCISNGRDGYGRALEIELSALKN